MRVVAPKGSKAKKTLIKVDKFDGGYSSLVDEARQKPEFAVQSMNLQQYQDGLWGTRWGFNYYGTAITGETSIDGASEYIKTDGTREIIAVGGTTGKIFKSQDGGSWTQIGSTTLTAGKTPHFLQTKSYLYISNGVDTLLRYDGTSLLAYSGLSAPTNLAFTLSGVTSGSYTYYYVVTALNDIGETVGSNRITVTTNKERDSFSASSDHVNLTWDAVASALRYNVYVGSESGYEVFLDTITTNAYTDVGTTIPNGYIVLPDDDTTAAPKFSSMEMSGNRLWATGDPDNKFRVYGSGVGQYLGFFSPFYGGFWVDLEKGGRDTPQRVVHYRTGKGDPIATVLCSSPDGLGAIWQIEVSAQTVNGISFSVPVTYKIVGSIGADSPLSVVKARDNIGFSNKKGIFFLRNKAQLVNVLSTDEASQAIRPDYLSLNQAKISEMCAYYYDGKIFFSAAESSTNDVIFIYDLERNNWTWKWTQGVKRFLEYTENAAGDSRTHFLGVPPTGNQLWEISENFEGDFGQPFYQGYISPLLPVSDDKTDVLKTKESLIELGRPKGQITYELLGIEAKRGLSTLGSRTITDTVSSSGMSTDAYSAFLMSDSLNVPTTFTQASVKKALKIRKRVYALQHKVYSQASNTKFTLLSIQTTGKLLTKRTPSSWRQ
jgi:hypothetical protein